MMFDVGFEDTTVQFDVSMGAQESGTGKNGTTFIPSVSKDGVISWTNDGGLPNPKPVNIKGEKGDSAEVDIVQETGDSTTAVMSQNAVTEVINGLSEIVNDFNSDIADVIDRVGALEESGGGSSVEVLQETGTSTTAVMSQNATSLEFEKQDIRLTNVEYFASGNKNFSDDTSAYIKAIPENVSPYAQLKRVGGLTRKSKNLLRFPWYQTTKTDKGITFTVNNNGTMIANGTATEAGGFTFIPSWDDFNGKIELNGTYTLSGISGSTSTYRLQLYVDGNSTAICYSTPVTFTANGTITQLSMFFEKGASFNNVSIMPMLNEGTVALPFEPYFEGFKESKVTELFLERGNAFNFDNINPSFKGENGEVVTRGGAYNIDIFTGTSGGSTAVPIEYIDKLMYLTKGNYYVYYDISFDGTVADNEKCIIIYGVHPSGVRYGINATSAFSGHSFEVTNNCYATIRVGGKQPAHIRNLIISKVSNAEYSPYNPTVIPIPEEVQNLDGYGIGISEVETNYVDVERKVFRKEYDVFHIQSYLGSYNASNNLYSIPVSYLAISPKNRNVYCNYLNYADVTSTVVTEGICYDNTLNNILIRKKGFTTKNDYENWLTNNNVYIVERIVSPVETDISSYSTIDEYINIKNCNYLKVVNANNLDAPTSISALIIANIDNKLDKKPNSSGSIQAYCNNTSGNQEMVSVATSASANTIARRYANGRLRVGTPAEGEDATPKAYVEEKFSPKLYLHNIVVSGQGADDDDYMKSFTMSFSYLSSKSTPITNYFSVYQGLATITNQSICFCPTQGSTEGVTITRCTLVQSGWLFECGYEGNIEETHYISFNDTSTAEANGHIDDKVVQIL